MANKTSIAELAKLLTTPYSHLELGQVNDHAAYVMNFKEVFPFHRHIQDEMYLVLDGEVTLRFKNAGPVILKKGESTVVRAYTTHSSESQAGALVLMVKPKEMFPHPSEVE
jgi:mannose-6-phosphate isomerase-like protein (cupin superfamily)